MQKDKEKYVVRFPEGLRDLVKETAYANGRSINGEIMFRLRQAYGLVGEVKQGGEVSQA